MTARKNPPLLFVGGLSGKVFIATRYKQDPDNGHYSGAIHVHEKFDVTEKFETIARNLGWVKP